MESLAVALVQLDSTADGRANVDRATRLAAEALARGAELVCLPEMFNYLGALHGCAERAEEIPGPSLAPLRELAREHKAWIAAGSVLERNGDARPFNTSVILSPTGDVAAQYRKIHLFDIDLPGRIRYRESAFMSAGREPAVCETPFGAMGLSICYDLRFPELYRQYSAQGAALLLVPAAFTMETGRDHWEPLLRARAIENQCFVLATGQTGNKESGLVCYGRSMAVDPWGIVIAQAADEEGILMVELDLTATERARERLPALRHRRL
jgi:predicted amidohydrolase